MLTLHRCSGRHLRHSFIQLSLHIRLHFHLGSFSWLSFLPPPAGRLSARFLLPPAIMPQYPTPVHLTRRHATHFPTLSLCFSYPPTLQTATAR